jgi:hypothetical protein
MYPAGIFYSHLTNNEENMLLELRISSSGILPSLFDVLFLIVAGVMHTLQTLAIASGILYVSSCVVWCVG